MQVLENVVGKIPPEKGTSTWEYVTAFTCTLLLLCCGTSVGWNSPSLAILLSEDSPILLTIPQASWLASILSVGMIFGPLFALILVDRIGRHKSLLLTIIPALISWTLIIVATNITTLFAARLCGGLTIGMSMTIPPMYLGEISSTRLRGTFVMLFSVMFGIGTLFAFVVGPQVSIRSMAMICLALSILYLVSFWRMPESPYFLAMTGRVEEAEGVLVKLRGKTHVTEELDEIVKFTTSKTKTNFALRSSTKNCGCKCFFGMLFQDRASCKALFIMVLMSFAHHFGGYFSLQAYAEIIFAKIGDVKIAPANSAIIMMTVRVITAIAAGQIVDYCGRRILYAISGAISASCTLLICLYFFAREVFLIDVSAYSYMAIGTIFVYVFAISFGILPLSMVILSEVFGTDVKAKANCMLMILHGVLSTLALKLYMVTSNAWGHWVPFACFTVTLVFTNIFVLHLLPETKGKSFAEIQVALSRVSAGKGEQTVTAIT